MSYQEWKEEDFETLLHTIHHGNCILMLGPDASFEEKDGKTLSIMEILANHLAKNMDSNTKGKINISDLAQVCQQYSMETGRTDLEVKVKKFYEERWDVSNDFYRNLAAIPFFLVITTTPDNMFKNALIETKKKPIIERYSFRGKNPALIEMGSVENPLLFHLYGTIDEPSSLLLTESDLLDFLVAIISENPLPDNIISELHDVNNSFLFIGFGFRHWYLRILLHVLQGRGKKSRSFAMEQFNNVDDFERTILFFRKSDFKIHIFKFELNAFVRKLRKKIEDITPLNLHYSKTLYMETPKIFICHANEDISAALKLYKELEQDGFRPWIDKEHIRAGHEWDPLIKKTIKNTDYFIVLQSKALYNKKIGYVNKEIKIALERQLEFRPGIRFIIPVRIEKCPLLESIQDYHTIDIFERFDVDVKKMISAIKRDYANRGK